jgi:hypothetical protein
MPETLTVFPYIDLAVQCVAVTMLSVLAWLQLLPRTGADVDERPR